MGNFKRGLVHEIKKELNPTSQITENKGQNEEFVIASVVSKFFQGFFYLFARIFVLAMIILSSVAITALMNSSIRLMIINLLRNKGVWI